MLFIFYFFYVFSFLNLAHLFSSIFFCQVLHILFNFLLVFHRYRHQHQIATTKHISIKFFENVLRSMGHICKEQNHQSFL